MIDLRVIDKENFWTIINLSVGEEQKSFVVSNAVSIAQSKVQPECIPLAVYDGETPVGFVMYCIDTEDNEYWIYRLMIDQRYQSKGYGQQAMKKLISLIQQDKSHHVIYISFEPENRRAEMLYRSLGFTQDGRIIDHEIVYKLEYE
ncbi:GNAT family N-acetyltransferase [Paenibacillus sp. 22594]|uniref:GNAT family N-acetyltransferase n=1 Tax=Paenibacillus sp. 22594 TaxID=3453947 RepID=UPI003F87BE65